MKQDGLISATDIASAEVSGLETAKPNVSFYSLIALAKMAPDFGSKRTNFAENISVAKT